MPRLTGLEVLERIVEFDPSIDVILMTAHYSTESAVEAVKKGATDYLNKPISIATLRERVGKLLDEARRRQNSLRLEGELLASSEFEGIIGRSPLMWDLFSQIRRVAPHYRSLLVTGPTGTGKDLIAQAVHRRSPAHAGRYAVLNCSAVVETLFESELFGHVRGSLADRPQCRDHPRHAVSMGPRRARGSRGIDADGDPSRVVFHVAVPGAQSRRNNHPRPHR